MTVLHPSRVVKLLSNTAVNDVGSDRHDAVIDAVMEDSYEARVRVRIICGPDIEMNAETEAHMAAGIAALLVANYTTAHELLPLIHSELSANSHIYSWAYVPPVVIGCMDAITFLDAIGESIGSKFNDELPMFLGIMLRKYGKWSPSDGSTNAHECSKWSVDRSSELLTTYTQTANASENQRRISIIIGKMSEYRNPYPKCTHPLLAQVSYRALKFLDPGCQISAINSVMNADRFIPKDSEAA